MTSSFNGLGLHMGNLHRLSNAQSRSISPENFTGHKGAGGMATEGTGAARAAPLGGQGWKVSPSVDIEAGTTFEMADIEGPGAIQQIWLTPTGTWRHLILRMYWDDQEQPSVEVPLGDFFCSAWGRYAQLSSLAVCVNPRSGLNCYWEMPFRTRCRMTVENISGKDCRLYYQVNYALTDVGDDAAYFHAQFRRSNPLPLASDHTILDGVAGQGQFVGCYMAWVPHRSGWWGEGEIKFFLDGDEFPTICGTGTEDYFCGSYDFDVGKENGGYREFTTPYSGLHQVIQPDGLYNSQQRFGMYRWHVMDPIRFRDDLRVTIQALGWRDGAYAALQDDIASVAYWYQTLPTAPFPDLPDAVGLDPA